MFLVSGATGNVGRELVRALVSAGEQVRALTRGDGSPVWPSGVEVVTGGLRGSRPRLRVALDDLAAQRLSRQRLAVGAPAARRGRCARGVRRRAIAAIDPLDIAAVAALAHTVPGHDGATYRLTGPEPIFPADRVRVLAAILGRELRLEPLTNAEAKEQMSASMPPEYVNAFFGFFVDGTYDDSVVHATVQQLLGRPPQSFGEWANAHANAFR